MGSSDLPLVLPDRYQPLRHIADGGMAAVWEARDTVLDRRVAVKLLAESLAADPDARARFTREAKAAARLSAHPHVVTVYDTGEHEGRAYLVMALYPGGTVADRLRQGPLDPETALRWLAQAADGLDAAHAEGVVHRDVKPANLLLDERDRVAVGDFGIATAQWAASVTQTGLVVGTAAYLAPEQRDGSAATAASDRYALGIVAHQMLTGRRPVDEESAATRPLAAGVAPVIARATARDPQERHPSCRAFVAELERALALGDDATTVSGAATEATAVHRGAGLAGAGAAAAGLGAAGVGADAARAATPRTPRPARDRPAPGEPVPAPVAAAPGVHRGPDPGPSTGPRRGGLALVLLAALLLAAGATAAIVGGGDDEPRDQAATPTTATEPDATTSAPAEEEPATPAPAPEPEPEPEPVSEDPRALNDQGFALFQEGRYDEAIPLLERAVAGLEENPDDINYAYALYNLGASLRRAGRPADAIPYLERRLEVSDFKVDVVQEELDAARAEAGLGGQDDGDDDDDGSADAGAAKAKKDKGPKAGRGDR